MVCSFPLASRAPADCLLRSSDDRRPPGADSPALRPGDLVTLGVSGTPVADVEQRGENDPEPSPTGQPHAGYVKDHVDQGREREEDDAEKRQDERVESRIDEGRPGDPDYKQPESGKETREYGQ